jgi:hypothetical protein
LKKTNVTSCTMSGSSSDVPVIPRKLQVPPTTDLRHSSVHAAIKLVHQELKADPAVSLQDLFSMLVECLPPDIMLDPNVLCNVPLYQATRELLRSLAKSLPPRNGSPGVRL